MKGQRSDWYPCWSTTPKVFPLTCDAGGCGPQGRTGLLLSGQCNPDHGHSLGPPPTPLICTLHLEHISEVSTQYTTTLLRPGQKQRECLGVRVPICSTLLSRPLHRCSCKNLFWDPPDIPCLNLTRATHSQPAALRAPPHLAPKLESTYGPSTSESSEKESASRQTDVQRLTLEKKANHQECCRMILSRLQNWIRQDNVHQGMHTLWKNP